MIGCGSVTELKSGPAFNKVEGSSLVAVMRRDAQKLKDYANRHNVPHFFTDANELIQHPEVDAVYIATPPKYHEDYAIAAMKAGKPVYVEKPMALDLAACMRMDAFSKQTGVKMVIAHYRRALPLFLEVKRLVDTLAIGQITNVRIEMLKKAGGNFDPTQNWRLDPAVAGGGYFYDLAPHQLDLVFYFFGKALSYYGSASNQAGLYPAEDTVSGTMLLENGIQFKGDWCFCAPADQDIDLFEITGTEGKLSFPVFGHTISLAQKGITKLIEFDPPEHNQQNLIGKIVPYFLGTGTNPCSAEEAMQSMRVMESFVYGTTK
jgi:predicted dehydrogenase